APFFGPIRAVSEPQTLYRQHGKNDHVSMNAAAKVQRELLFYEHYAAFLAEHCERMGVRVDRQRWEAHSWWHRHDRAMKEIAALPGKESPFVLIDDGAWELGRIAGRVPIPFLEREGQYWGPPADDQTAIAELERLRRAGARHLVIAWPAFWWLEYYSEFHR